MLDAFLLEQREFFDQGAFSVWKWRLLRRGCELLNLCRKGTVDRLPLLPWMPHCGDHDKGIWKDTPTPEQLADLDNIYALVWRTNSAMLELGLTDATVGHYRNEGLAIILNRHYESGTDRFSGEILDRSLQRNGFNMSTGKLAEAHIKTCARLRIGYRRCTRQVILLWRRFQTGGNGNLLSRSTHF